MLHYLLQTIIFQLVFLILYDLFHKKDTFFTWNRLYLLSTPLLSLVLPFIKLDYFNTPQSQVYVQKLESIITIASPEITVTPISSIEQPIMESMDWWLIIYCIGMGISFLLLIIKLRKLLTFYHISLKTIDLNNKIILLPNSRQAFSFWNTIFLGDLLTDTEKEQILIHEIVHINHKHSLDQLYFEFLKIFFWWNPLVYIFQSRITVLHEYIADEIAINTLDKKAYVEQLLNATFQTQEIPFANHFFNQSLIKKRIFMLQKSKSKSIAKFKYLLLTPVIAGILTYTSCNETSIANTKTNESFLKTTESSLVPDTKSSSITDAEPPCINQNSEYDKKLDNYLKISNGKDSEVIINITSIETSKTIRKIHLVRNQEYYIKNIPEGKYRLDVDYGDEYIEEPINEKCTGFFKKKVTSEVGKDILDFYTLKTDNGIHVPSYNLEISLSEPDDSLPTSGKHHNTKNSTEPICANKNSEYNKAIDNYLKLKNGKETEVIVAVKNINSSKTVRVIHLIKNQESYTKNIPEGKYQLYITYGETYTEKTENGKCTTYFKNEIATEKSNDILDFHIRRTSKGTEVPSYAMEFDLPKDQ